MIRAAAPLALAALFALAGCGKAGAPAAEATASSSAAAAATTAPASAAASAAAVGTTEVQAPFGRIRIEPVEIAEPSHVDAGQLKVTYLDATPPQVFSKAVEVGTFGTVGEWHVDSRFSDNPVIMSRGGGTWQGYTCEWTVLTELRPQAPVELASIETYADDSGIADKPQITKGAIGDIAKNQSFTVSFTGARNFTARYKRVGNTYELQGGPGNALSGC